MSSVAARLFPIPVSGTQKVLRYPILLFVFIIIIIELTIYFILRICVVIYEIGRNYYQNDKQEIWTKLHNASSYYEYVNEAKQLDKLENRDYWKDKDESYCYDVSLVQQIQGQMLDYLHNNNYEKLSNLLIEIFSHCLNWFETEALYNKTYHGTKNIVRTFINNVILSMERIAECDENILSNQEKIKLFTRLQHEFGRTALCLSGGGTMSFYQFGAIKAMLETDLLPTIISGTSGGAMVGSFIAVRTDDELKDLLNPSMHSMLNANNEPLLLKFRRFLSTGYIFDWEDWRDKTREITKGDTTFYEAYRLTGRIFNVTAISDNHRPVLLNYKTAPHIVIWSAVIASAALPMLMRPSPLICKNKYGKLSEFTSYGRLMCDGSIQCDIPTQRLLEDFNVKFNITVQCNPHVIAFYYNSRGTASSPVNHWGKSGMRGGFLSSLLEKLLKLEMRKWMKLLSDMDLLPQMFGHDWRHTATQETRGQITVNPTPPLSFYFKLINDPTFERMTEFFNGGRQMTYPYIGMMSTRLRLQRAIRKHIVDLDPTRDHRLLQTLLDGSRDNNNNIMSDERYKMILDKITNHNFVRHNSAPIGSIKTNINQMEQKNNDDSDDDDYDDYDNDNKNNNNNNNRIHGDGKGTQTDNNNNNDDIDYIINNNGSINFNSFHNLNGVETDNNYINNNNIKHFPHQTSVNLKQLSEREEEFVQNTFFARMMGFGSRKHGYGLVDQRRYSL